MLGGVQESSGEEWNESLFLLCKDAKMLGGTARILGKEWKSFISVVHEHRIV